MVRTRVYTVHLPRGHGPDSADAVFVREGFSWAACLFSVVWTLWHRMWRATMLIVAGTLALGGAIEALGPDEATEGVAAVAWALWIGFQANDWRRRSLERAGYETAGVVAGPALVEAERRWYTYARA